jgi:hypothetical protein
MNNQEKAEQFIEAARNFSKIIIDASSLIVLDALGILDKVRNNWELYTIPAVAFEAGDAGINIQVFKDAPSSGNNDQCLVQKACSMHLPILSEDRKILIAAEEANLYCFDSLILLELLRFKESISEIYYSELKRKLLVRNIYRPNRLQWAQCVGIAVDKYR